MDIRNREALKRDGRVVRDEKAIRDEEGDGQADRLLDNNAILSLLFLF